MEELKLTKEFIRTTDREWKYWGPYLSERQWGTVREDYSEHGNAWEYLSHDASRSRAYRWGEDGIGGLSDIKQRLCLSLALWNGRDPILKERLFGLTGNEGNHGEDVKECYYYLDSSPTHSYMKMLYKYPQAEFPYQTLAEENRRRGKKDAEFELLDTGIFNDDRYFDVFIEYAKANPRDILIQYTINNISGESSEVHVIPQLFFRNTWFWDHAMEKPALTLGKGGEIFADHQQLGRYVLYFEDEPEVLFCENETNARRLFGANGEAKPAKDGFHYYIISKDNQFLSAKNEGTKAGLVYKFSLPKNGSVKVRLRLAKSELKSPFINFEKEFSLRRSETDIFYGVLQRNISNKDEKMIQRQSFAGLLWSKQFYYFDIKKWLDGDPGQPAPPERRKLGRNSQWKHLTNAEVISMPDKWEYPWYAAWDLAFHCIPLAMIDPSFAKDQLTLLTREWYMHPNGQLPAYEWAFGDVNPPVHAWATWRVYTIDKKITGKGDGLFLERVFHKLLLNFTWWVNRKDEEGQNIFQGGFLGLDNIGVFDRSAPLPTGGHIEQSDATAWMAMYSLNMMRIALELALENPAYQDLASKFFEHFLAIAYAMFHRSGDDVELWDSKDEFYYDVLHMPGNGSEPLRVRSMVGLIPLFAVEVIEPELLEELPEFKARLEWFLENRPEMASLVSRWTEPGVGERRLLSLLRGHRIKSLLKRMLDENEFLSPFGIRALSKYYQSSPYRLEKDGMSYEVSYQPGESDSGLFGGNSNWRGPIWFPVNYLIIESLQRFHHYYGDDFKVEAPVGSGTKLSLEQISDDLSRRLIDIFRRDSQGLRPVFGSNDKFQFDQNFKDYLVFHEYFDGDTGRGVGASHQTGWTALVSKLLQPRLRDSKNKTRERELQPVVRQPSL